MQFFAFYDQKKYTLASKKYTIEGRNIFKIGFLNNIFFGLKYILCFMFMID